MKSKENKCLFDEAWVVVCGKSANVSGFCDKHENVKCVSCGSQATRTCSQTGQFVCGEPLCSCCTHNINPEGTNGGIGFNAQQCPEGMKRHTKKSEQKHQLWFMQEVEK